MSTFKKINKSTCDFLVTENMVDEVKKILNEDIPTINLIVNKMVDRNITRIYFVACGSPLSAAKTATLMAERYSEIQCFAYSAQEFIDNPPYKLDDKCAVIGISDYGKTPEVIASVKKGIDAGSLTIVFTSKDSNPIAKIGAEHVIAYQGGCIWEIHLLLSYAVVGEYIRLTSPSADVEIIMNDLYKLPDVLSRLIKEWEIKGKLIGQKMSGWDLIYTVAAGSLRPLAYKEGIVTCMEFTWTHGSVIESGEFKHGPLEMVEEGSSFLFLQNTDDSRTTTDKAINFAKRYTDNIIVVDNAELNHNLHNWVAPFVMFVPLEWIFFYHSEAKGHNPDDRRYYGGLVEY